jgi:hypothetical protein
VEFTGKGGEEPLSGEVGRVPPLECPAVRRPSAGPTWRDAEDDLRRGPDLLSNEKSMTEDEARITHVHTRNRLYFGALCRDSDQAITTILAAF